MEIVVRANLIQTPAYWATWRTFPTEIRKPCKRDIDLASSCDNLVGLHFTHECITNKAVIDRRLRPLCCHLEELL